MTIKPRVSKIHKATRSNPRGLFQLTWTVIRFDTTGGANGT